MNIPQQYNVHASFYVTVLDRFHEKTFFVDRQKRTMEQLGENKTDKFPLQDKEKNAKIDPSTGARSEMDDEQLKERVGKEFFKDVVERLVRHVKEGEGVDSVVVFLQASQRSLLEDAIPDAYKEAFLFIDAGVMHEPPVKLLDRIAASEEASLKRGLLTLSE